MRLTACCTRVPRQLSDKNAELANALGVAKQSGALTRSGRYAALIKDNKVVAFNAADAGGGMECTLANALYDAL
jgi:peroxiredoxin